MPPGFLVGILTDSWQACQDATELGREAAKNSKR